MNFDKWAFRIVFVALIGWIGWISFTAWDYARRRSEIEALLNQAGSLTSTSVVIGTGGSTPSPTTTKPDMTTQTYTYTLPPCLVDPTTNGKPMRKLVGYICYKSFIWDGEKFVELDFPKEK